MGVRFNGFVSSLILATAAVLSAGAAIAQEKPVVFQPLNPISDKINTTFGSNSFRNPINPLEDIVGLRGYPEYLIAGSGYRLHQLYQDLLTQQTTYDPMVRTADLPNPYSSSLLLSPNSVGSTRVTGRETLIERPPAPQFPQPMPVAPQPEEQPTPKGVRSLY
jgi:hypothetical protein